jgi:predicted phage baseplate assembly protein
VRWEYLAGPDDWRALEVLSDHTRALTLSGTVRLRGPAAHPPDPGSGRHWIRCRLVSGAHDCPPSLALLAVNPVLVLDAVARGPERLGTTHGGACEELALLERPVVASSVHLRVEDPGGTIDDGWREVAVWDESGPSDRDYRLDPMEGVVAFGDGQAGRVPPAGSTVTARLYRVGGGPEGNLPAGRLVASPDTAFAVLQPFAATGGTAAEPLERAHARALEQLERPARAVTVADLEALALETPGARLGRAGAVPAHHPDYGCLPADGVVTVVVLPACGDPPLPSPGLLAAVRRHLCPRRVLATELHVAGPAYVPVAISATLHVEPGARTTPATAAAALTAFLDPLRGGEDGRGWPFGRPVLDSEVMAVLGALDGVRYVDSVGISGPADVSPRCGSLPLCPLELPDSGLHRITVEES